MRQNRSKLLEQLRRVLIASDDLRRPPWRGSSCAIAGHCYVASECLFVLLGGAASGWTPMHVRVGKATHWFLRHRMTGEIVDATADQFQVAVPYEQARGCGFLTKEPSRRTVLALARLDQVKRNVRGSTFAN